MKESGDKTLSLVPFTMVFLAGKIFTVDKIYALVNPTTDEGETIAHIMADHGHYLSDSDIDILGNPKTKFGTSIGDLVKINISKRNALTSPQEIIEQFRLIYQDGKPTFEITTHDKISFGKTIRANWYRYYVHSSDIVDYNTFTLEMYESDKIWAVRINTLRKTDSYNHLYRKMMVLELAVKLNEVLRNHLELDFSNHFGNQYVYMGADQLDVSIC